MKRYVVQHWVAGWNLIGYGPNHELVLHGVSAEHAIDYIVGEIAHVGDWAAQEEGAAAYTQAWNEAQDWNTPEGIAELERDARLHGDNSGRRVHVDNHAYWVGPCLTINCDQVKNEEE